MINKQSYCYVWTLMFLYNNPYVSSKKTTNITFHKVLNFDNIHELKVLLLFSINIGCCIKEEGKRKEEAEEMCMGGACE